MPIVARLSTANPNVSISVILGVMSAVVLLCTPRSAGAQQYPHRLTAPEVRALMTNSTTYMPGNFGPKTTANYRSPDGRIHVKSPSYEDFGTYRITDDGLFCSTYKKARNGQETCQTIWQTGPDTFEAHLPNGQVIKGPRPVPEDPGGL